MVDVKCKSCGCSIEIEDAYHAERKGFRCPSCHSRLQWAGGLIVLAIVVVFVIIMAASSLSTASRDGGVEETPRSIAVEYGTNGVRRTISIEPVDWPAREFDDELLHDDWPDLLIDADGLGVLRSNPVFPPEYALEYLESLKAMVETSTDREIVLLLLDEDARRAFRVRQSGAKSADP